jgi:putative ABC transport system permease protein
VNQLAGALSAQAVISLYVPVDTASGLLPQPGPGGGPGGYPPVILAQVTRAGRGESVSQIRDLYVATSAVLAHYGIAATQIDSGTEIIASPAGIGNLQIFDPARGPGRGQGSSPGGSASGQGPVSTLPSVQTIEQLPEYTSAPITLITAHAIQELGLETVPAGWLVQTPGRLTASQIDTAQKAAASSGLYVETRSEQKSLASLRNWSTTAGILVALGVLGMTVGLIRSETANDLRTLSATGASSTTRRTLTGATAAALALLGALLGTAGAYMALLAWHRSDLRPLTNIPAVDLVVILAGLPLIAGVAGWLLAGRNPRVISRRPIE